MRRNEISEILKERKAKTLVKAKSQIHLKLSSKSSKLPMILTPRSYFDSPKKKKIKNSMQLALRLSVLGPLPSLKIKTNRRDTFRESPIRGSDSDAEDSDKDLHGFVDDIIEPISFSIIKQL